MEVRRATIEDAPAIAALDARSGAAPWSERAYRDALDAPDRALWVVSQGTEGVVGFLLAGDFVDQAEILTVVVDAAVRRRGVGHALVREAQAWASSRARTRIALEVHDRNAAAIALYRRAGFRLEGRRRGYYEDGDALILAAEVRVDGENAAAELDAEGSRPGRDRT